MKLDFNFKANVKDKTTTFFGVCLFVLGVVIAIAPFVFTELNSDIYTALIEYSKYICVTLIFSGLVLIGAIRQETNQNQ